MRESVLAAIRPGRYDVQDGEATAGTVPRDRPRGSWLMAQSWQDTFFAHWPVPVEAVRPLVPAPLEVDCWDGQAWVSLVALRAARVRPRFVPPLPVVSTLHQLNFRTYVTYQGDPGVYFITIDTDNPLAALGARILYRLPYYYARITMDRDEGEVRWASRRPVLRAGGAELRAVYRPVGQPFTPQPGTLDAWLLNRFRLFNVTRAGRVQRGEIHHQAWRLHPVAATIGVNRVAAARRVSLPHVPLAMHYAGEMDALFWPLKQVRASE